MGVDLARLKVIDPIDWGDDLGRLRPVWQGCFEALAPGGRLAIIVGDVCLSRRRNNGRHTVVPLRASIHEQCRRIRFDNLVPIIWHKITNARREGGTGAANVACLPRGI